MVVLTKLSEWLPWSLVSWSRPFAFYDNLNTMMFPNWAKNILFLLVYMISGLVLVIIIEGLLTGTALTPLNTAIESFVSYLRRPFTTTLIVGITKLGNASVLLSATALIAVLLIMRRRYYDAALFVAAIILSVLSLSVLKNTFQIARPGA